jgi:CRP/FNR family transcriptional regulator, cyclic AMP receptor protein
MTDTLAAFKQNYLVCGLSDEAIAQVAAMGKIEKHLARETLIRVNEKSSDLYVVLDGRVIIMTADGDKLAEVGPGSVLGEMALVDDRPRSAEVVCLGITNVARIPAQDLRKFMWQNKDIGFIILANLARVLSGRLRQADAKIDDLMGCPDNPWKDSL